MQKTIKSTIGTSYHNVTIKTTISKLVDVLGEPTYSNNTGEDKVNMEWVCETESGEVVTIYDWKESRRIWDNEEIVFHIGGKRLIDTIEAKEELEYELALIS